MFDCDLLDARADADFVVKTINYQSGLPNSVVLGAFAFSYLDDVQQRFGSAATTGDVATEWDTGQTNHALITGLSGSNNWILTTLARLNAGYNFGFSNSATPTLWITSGAAATDEWIALYHDGSNAYLDTGKGSFIIQDAIISSTTIYMGDNDALLQGTGAAAPTGWDFSQKFDGTNEVITFNTTPSGANAPNYSITLAAGGAGGAAQTGGSFLVNCGAGAATGAAGDIRLRSRYVYMEPQASAGNTYATFEAAGSTLATSSTEFRLDLGSSLTTGLALSWSGVYGCKIDDAAIAAYAGANDAVGKSVYTTYQGGGTSTSGAGKAAGDAYFTGGAGSAAVSGVNVGGTGTSFSVYPGAGGAGFGGGAAGAAGRFKIWNAAGSGYISIVYGTIDTSAGDLYIIPAGGTIYSYNIAPSNNNVYNLAQTGAVFKAAYLGEDRTTATAQSNSGLYLGLAQEFRLRYNKDATGFPANSVVFGVSNSGSASVDKLALSASAITGFTALASTAGSTLYAALQGGGVPASGAGMNAADFYLSGGAGSAAVSGVNVGGTGTSIFLTPGAGGAGFGGGAAGAAGAVIIRQPGGTPADDEIQIWNDGTKSNIQSKNTQVFIMANTGVGAQIASNGLLPWSQNSYGLGISSQVWQYAYLGEDRTTATAVSTSGAFFGLAQESRIYYNKDRTSYPANSLILGVSASGTPSADRLALSSAAITGFAQTVAATAGNSLWAALQTGAATTGTVGYAGASATFTTGAGSASAAGDAGNAGDWNFVGAVGGNATGGNGGQGGGFAVTLGAPGTGGTPLLGGALTVTGAAEILRLTRTGAMTITPGTAVAGLTITQANAAGGLVVDDNDGSSYCTRFTGKRCMYLTQDIANGYGVYANRDIAEAGASPLATFLNDNASNTQPTIYSQQDGAGYGISLDQNGAAAAIFCDHDDTGTTPSVYIDRDGNNAARIFGLQIDVDNAGAGNLVGGIDLSTFAAGEPLLQVPVDAGAIGAYYGRIAVNVVGVGVKYLALYEGA